MGVAAESLRRAWNQSFHALELAQWSPAEDVVRFAARHLFRRTGPTEFAPRRNVGRILDLGCGVGRHVVMLARAGLEVAGIDVSDFALDACRDWLAAEGLSAQLEQGSVDALPYPDAHFGAVVSHGVLDQVPLSVARGAMREVRRVLAPGGLVHLNLRAPDSFDYGRGEEIERGTYLLAEGHEKGLPQHFFTPEELDALLDGLRVLDWEKHVRELDRSGATRDTRFAISAERP